MVNMKLLDRKEQNYEIKFITNPQILTYKLKRSTKLIGKFCWDRVNDEEEILIRRMILDNPITLVKIYPKDELKKIFLNNTHRFDKRNIAFWKLILGVNDDEINENANKLPWRSRKFWNY